MITASVIAKYLLVASLVLCFSGLIDCMLWYQYQYLVPSWAIGIMSIACGVFLYFIGEKLSEILEDAQKFAERLEGKINGFFHKPS